MELIMASTLFNSPSSGCMPFIALSLLPSPGIMPRSCSMLPIFLICLSCSLEIVQGEGLLAQLLFQILNLVGVEGLLGFFDQGEHIAHP